MVKSILRIGVPTGLENGMFQVGKLLVAGMITTYGTASIAANAVCNNVTSMNNIPASAIGLAAVTVVGRCIGAQDTVQARAAHGACPLVDGSGQLAGVLCFARAGRLL